MKRTLGIAFGAALALALLVACAVYGMRGPATGRGGPPISNNTPPGDRGVYILGAPGPVYYGPNGEVITGEEAQRRGGMEYERLMRLPLDTSQQTPLFDPVTGKRYFVPGVDSAPSSEHPAAP